jgi:hypothetical protein
MNFLWLARRDLKAETESEMTTAQDQALQVNIVPKKVLKTGTDSKFRLSQQYDGKIDHTV